MLEMLQRRSKRVCFGRFVWICVLIERVCFAKSETLQHRPADLAFSLENLIEVAAVEAMALGESDL